MITSIAWKNISLEKTTETAGQAQVINTSSYSDASTTQTSATRQQSQHAHKTEG